MSDELQVDIHPDIVTTYSESYEPELDPPLLTAELMPASPGVWNRNPQAGPIVKSRVLGFAFSTEDQEHWAEDHGIEPHESRTQTRLLARKAMFRRLPPKFRQMSIVYVRLARCIIITSNRTAKDLEKAEDMETINVVRKALDVSDAPQWWRPGWPFDVL